MKALLGGTKFKKRVYTIVRRSQSTQSDTNEDLTPCPISNELIPEMNLECPTTSDIIPMCICTGKHMITDDWTFCPISGLPALYSKYLQYIHSEAITPEHNAYNSDVYALDPICGKDVYLSQIKQVRKTSSF